MAGPTLLGREPQALSTTRALRRQPRAREGGFTAFAHAWSSAAEVGASSHRHHRGGRTGRFGLRRLAGTIKNRGRALCQCFAEFATDAGVGKCLAFCIPCLNRRTLSSQRMMMRERVCGLGKERWKKTGKDRVSSREREGEREREREL